MPESLDLRYERCRPSLSLFAHHCFQISACLLSAMPQEALREAAFNCWASMLFNLEEEDIEALLETTFFIVQHYWPTLTSSAAQSVKHMVEYLLAKYKEVLTHYINKLPTLSGLKGLEDIEHKLNRMRPNLDTTSALITFSQRISHDHSGVVHQALLDLVRYLRDHKNSIAMSTLNQRSDSIIATLLRALLDCVCKYNGNQVDIARLCVECIGLIGCHDSNQIETFREQPSLVILNNFTRAEEVTDFSLFILEAVLVPAFLSATDTKLQGFLSFAMQELLDRSEVKAACATHGSERLEGAEIYRKWIAMPEQVREVLTPFLSSRYMIAPMAPTTTSYPIFRPGKPYGSWLRQFVVDLLRKGQNPHAQLIFEPLTRVIRVKDLSAAEFLLPYLVLHILLSDENNQAQKEEVLEELKLILRHEPADGASYGEREDLARFCHVSMMSWANGCIY
jgi:serine/threonine-protein kinase ATR